MNSLSSRLATLLTHWNQWILAPGKLKDPVQSHFSRLQTTVILILIAMGLVTLALHHLVTRHIDELFIALLAAILLLLTAYGVSRLGYRRAASVLLCVAPTVGAAIAYLSGDILALVFLIFSVVLAGSFFTLRETALFAVFNLAVAGWLILAVPFERRQVSLYALFVFLAIFSILRLILMRHRDALVNLQQQQLREGELNLRALAENAKEGILVNRGDVYVFANRYIEELLGYVPGSLPGSRTQDLIHPQTYEQACTRHQLRLKGMTVPEQYETLLRHKDGTAIPVEVTAAITQWQGQQAELNMVRDIRVRKQREAALREAEAKWRAISQNSPDFIILCDTQGKILYINRIIAGLNVEDVIGSSVYDYNDAAANNIIREAFLKVTVSASPTMYQTTYTAPNGEKVWFETHLGPLLDEHGGVNEIIMTARDVTQRVKDSQQIQASQKELSGILNNMQDTFYRTDREGRIINVYQSVYRMLGYTVEELIGTRVADLYVDKDGREKFMRALEDADGEVTNHETILRHKDGTEVWVSTNAHYYRDEQGEIAGVEGTTRNVTLQKQTESLMHMLSSALQQTADLVMIADAKGIITYVNSAFESVTGYGAAETLGKSTNLLRSGRQNREFYQILWTTILAGKPFSEVFINRRKDGGLFYEEKTITPIRDNNGDITHFVSTGKDITDRIQTQERLRFMAHHDALTELPNRTLFLDRLKQAMARARWHDRKIAVMFLDLDRFKTINDTLGHNVGDQLLVKLTQRLSASVRAGDTVARFGGDEFAMLLDDIASEQDISFIAKKVLATMAPAFEIGSRELFISCSIGISIYPRDGEDSETLLRNADIAMYRAKDLGRNNYQFYSSDLSARAVERLSLENALRYALQRQEFFLLYQPQFDVRSGKPFGAEALLRWQHPVLGLILPAEFIPLLEETGMIVQVGEWVLREACAQAVRWHQDGIDLKMAVNLSSRQFNNAEFVNTVRTIIEETGVQPDKLELELTESMLLRNASQTTQALDTLNQLGVRLAIDDFGTGYSSLGYLRRFPIRTLKVDRSFVNDIIADPDAAAITTAIIVMAQSLYLEVIAEGVESLEQLSFLQGLDCNLMQGFYFAAGLSDSEIRKLYRGSNNVHPETSRSE